MNYLSEMLQLISGLSSVHIYLSGILTVALIFESSLNANFFFSSMCEPNLLTIKNIYIYVYIYMMVFVGLNI